MNLTEASIILLLVLSSRFFVTVKNYMNYGRRYGEHSETYNQLSHMTFTCSKLSIETLEKGVKYSQS